MRIANIIFIYTIMISTSYASISPSSFQKDEFLGNYELIEGQCGQRIQVTEDFERPDCLAIISHSSEINDNDDRDDISKAVRVCSKNELLKHVSGEKSLSFATDDNDCEYKKL